MRLDDFDKADGSKDTTKRYCTQKFRYQCLSCREISEMDFFPEKKDGSELAPLETRALCPECDGVHEMRLVGQ